MVRREWQRLGKNKIMILVLAAIILIPSIYTNLFLGAMWDPYGKVSNLPVAVVNHDRGTVYQDTSVKIGNRLVKKLEKSDAMNFQVTDHDSAQYGLKKGTYYMAIEIPENFSENATTLLDEKPQKMVISYYTNPGRNYIATKMSESAMEKIKNSVSEQVSNTYADIMLDVIGDAADGIREAADGSEQLSAGMKKIVSGQQKINTSLHTLAAGTVDLKAGTEELADGAGTLDEGAQELNTGAGTLHNGIREADEGARKLSDGAVTVQDGAGKLDQSTKTYTDGVTQAKKGSDQLKGGTKELNAGAETLSQGIGAYVQGVSDYTDGVNRYLAGAGLLSEGAKQLSPLQSLGEVSDAVTQISDAVSKEGSSDSLKAGSAKLAAGLDTISEQVSAIRGSATEENLKKLGNAVSQAEQIISQSASGIASASDGLESIQKKLDTLSATVDTMAGQMEKTAESQAQAQIQDSAKKSDEVIDTANKRIRAANAGIDQAIDRIGKSDLSKEEQDALIAALTDAKQEEAGKPETTDAAVDLSKLAGAYQSGLKEAKGGLEDAGASLGTLVQSLTTAKGYLGQIEQGLSGASVDPDAVTKLSAALSQAAAGAKQLDAGVGTLGTYLEQLKSATKDFPQAAEGIGRLMSGLSSLESNNETLQAAAEQLKSSGKTLTSGAKSASTGIEKLDAGMTTLSSGLQTLDTNGSLLAQGVHSLAVGSVTLSDGADALHAGTQKLVKGSSTLADGTDRLKKGTGTLAVGSRKLNSGADTLRSGSEKLAEGSDTLSDALDQAKNGSDQLSDGLSDGREEAERLSLSDEASEMFSGPVVAEETKITQLDNNGHFMAAYMMNVGLWVACIAFTLIYPLMDYEGKLKNGVRWWFSKATVLYPLSIVMAIVMVFLLNRILGFSPVDLKGTILVACVAACAYMSILYFFNVLMGKVGSFLMLIFTVVQLAGSAGTYPLEISGHYANLVHKWLPFSYGVDAFRNTIAAGESISFDVGRLILYIAVFTVLTILLFVIRSIRIHKGKPILADRIKAAGM